MISSLKLNPDVNVKRMMIKMDPTIKAVDNILDGLNAEAPERKYCDRHKKHKYHKGIAGGKRCVYCGYMK